jgi:hypothetical protein
MKKLLLTLLTVSTFFSVVSATSYETNYKLKVLSPMHSSNTAFGELFHSVCVESDPVSKGRPNKAMMKWGKAFFRSTNTVWEPYICSANGCDSRINRARVDERCSAIIVGMEVEELLVVPRGLICNSIGGCRVDTDTGECPDCVKEENL